MEGGIMNGVVINGSINTNGRYGENANLFKNKF